jgi:hypothetical protein
MPGGKMKDKMAIEGHMNCQSKELQDIKEIRGEMDRLALKMRQEEKVCWRYKLPMKKNSRWHVQGLLARGKKQVMRRWLRENETLGDIVEVVHICEPKFGKIFSDEEKRSRIHLI